MVDPQFGTGNQSPIEAEEPHVDVASGCDDSSTSNHERSRGWFQWDVPQATATLFFTLVAGLLVMSRLGGVPDDKGKETNVTSIGRVDAKTDDGSAIEAASMLTAVGVSPNFDQMLRDFDDVVKAAGTLMARCGKNTLHVITDTCAYGNCSTSSYGVYSRGMTVACANPEVTHFFVWMPFEREEAYASKIENISDRESTMRESKRLRNVASSHHVIDKLLPESLVINFWTGTDEHGRRHSVVAVIDDAVYPATVRGYYSSNESVHNALVTCFKKWTAEDHNAKIRDFVAQVN